MSGGRKEDEGGAFISTMDHLRSLIGDRDRHFKQSFPAYSLSTAGILGPSGRLVDTDKNRRVELLAYFLIEVLAGADVSAQRALHQLYKYLVDTSLPHGMRPDVVRDLIRQAVRAPEAVGPSMYADPSGLTAAIVTGLGGDLRREVEQREASEARILEALRIIADSQGAIEKELHATLAAISENGTFDAQKLERVVSFSLYTSSSDRSKANRLYRALALVIESCGIVILPNIETTFASVFSRFLGRTREALSGPELAERLKKLERAAEIAALDRPQAETDKVDAAVISELSSALKEHDEAIFVTRGFVAVKAHRNGKARVVIQALSQQQREALSESPLLAKSPQLMLTFLELAEDGALPGSMGDGAERPRRRKHEGLPQDRSPPRSEDGS